MAYVTRSFLPTHHAETMWRFKQLLVSCGWVIKASSDGLTFNTDGTVDKWATGFGTGALNVNNSYAWIVLEMPYTLYTYKRQILLERKSTTDPNYWRVAYSVAGFSMTGANASTAPTATDSKELITRYDQYGQTQYLDYYIFGMANATTPNRRIIMAADNAAPFGFWAVGVGAVDPVPKANIDGWFYLDPIAAGTYVVPTGNDGSTGDLDPYVLSGTYAGTSRTVGLDYYSLLTDPNGPCYGYVRYGTSTVKYPRFTPESLRSTIDYTMPSHPYTNLDVTAPVYWVNRNTNSGVAATTRTATQIPTLGYDAMLVKGVSTTLRLVLQRRGTGDTLSTGANTRDRIVVGDFALPWDGSVPQL